MDETEDTATKNKSGVVLLGEEISMAADITYPQRLVTAKSNSGGRDEE